MEPQSSQPALIVIVGETASGKSALAMRLAERFDGEIIAADSWTVYKDFNIGTAKPNPADRVRVRHHLLDVADPRSGFSAAEYKRLALAAIDDITARGKLPILVGGTGLYIDSVIFDYSFLPAASSGVRERLNDLSIGELLQKIDELMIDASGIDLRNKRRLIRLIESNGRRPTRAASLRPNTLLIGLKISKQALQARIAARVDAMLAAGLEQEVAALHQKYGWGAEPMKGIGYREFRGYFSGTQTLAQTRDRIISSTLQLAKKQRTWFKRNDAIHWIEPNEQNNEPNQRQQAEIVALVTTFLNK